ncbi:hypothetical protein LY474_11575 [Myxococcus stipitatus]|uniref:hypothetical protein n=1 Tax=Myxococcus stipitatus TaxID=83455 RepID=UPI001F34C31B|nr:hypothetical protein [Myxococcus stipitatus]MCE9668451.1 hypothetical protein [Myxococcus stipitatus]
MSLVACSSSPSFEVHAPATLALSFDPDQSTFQLPVSVDQLKGSVQDITVTIEGLPPYLRLEQDTIVLSRTSPEGSFSVVIEEFASYGAFPITVVASNKEHRAEASVVLEVTAGNGVLDTSFGVNGVVKLEQLRTTYLSQLVIQPDGKWLMAGSTGYVCTPSSSQSTNLLVVRALPDGSLDPDFNNIGLNLCNYSEGAGRLDYLDDGRIFVFGGAGHVGFNNRCAFDPPTNGTFLARFTASGMRDTTLNGVGTNTFPSPYLESARLDSQGRILGVGSLPSGTAQLVRFTSEGVLDGSFGTDGVILDEPGTAELSKRLFLLPDDRFIVAGTSSQGLVLRRFHPDGTLDESFQFTPPAGLSPDALVRLLPDGKLLLGGMTRVSAPGQSTIIVLARVDANGSLDPEFGTGGFLVMPAPEGSSEQLNEMELQADGVIVLMTTIIDAEWHRSVGLIHLSGDGKQVLQNHRLTFPDRVEIWSAAIDAEGYLRVVLFWTPTGECFRSFPALLRFHPYR